ncbi:putative inner membrane protein [Variovorax boronicumulans]|uniref:YeeE/YedE family protein n=1 Tax=Variovorax boronicumulans TaxID=436515 RepID=UPI000BB396A5|nr:YeeE/YedE family protein [Variovorax boronicumulans]PBI84376.1 putative inner membrane protein [Variovorax boronicumulans]
MSIAQLSLLTTLALVAAFVLSAVFGAVARATRFCTMGAISDVVALGDWTRVKQWAAAGGVALIGFSALVSAGLVDADRTLYASHQILWLAALVGGLLFGVGMVLSSGCGNKTLVRLGGGSLKALVVLVLMGVSAFATLKGITAVLRVATVDAVHIDLAMNASLPDVLAASFQLNASLLRLALGLVLGGALLVWAAWGRETRDVRSLIGGMLIGALVVVAWWLSGHWAVVEEHPLTLEHVFLATNSGRAEALSFVTPVAYALDWLMFYSDANKRLTLGIVSVAGVVAGAALHALWSREFRWEGFAGTGDLAHHATGAVLMGIGGVTAMGCTIGQGLSALSTLSIASLPAIAGIVIGAVVSLKYQSWQLERTL